MITTNVVNTSELLEDVRQILDECRTGNLIPEGHQIRLTLWDHEKKRLTSEIFPHERYLTMSRYIQFLNDENRYGSSKDVAEDRFYLAKWDLQPMSSINPEDVF